MQFSELAEYLQKLESTSSRTEMTKILAELFGKASPEDGRLIAYISQGRLGPAYNAPDFGMADKSVIKALGPEAVEIFKTTGDLGKTVEKMKNKKLNPKDQINTKQPNIKQVYERLMKIADAGGEGSQEKKQRLVSELMQELDGVSAKYAVKVILGKLRTGFSDMTVLDSLSWMLVGDKSMREKIEGLYNVRADLGEVVERVKRDKGVKGEVNPKIGTPVLMAKGERATSAEEIWERNGECALEYKLDGLRIQAHIRKPQTTNPKSQGSSKSQITNIKLFSRGLEDVTAMYPDVVEGLNKQIKTDCIVEGEMIAIGANGRFLPFQETAQRKRKYDIAEMRNKIPLVIYVFDVLAIDGESVMSEHNEDRRKKLEKLVGRGDTVRLMERTMVEKVSDIDDFFKQAIADGTEGIFAKRLTGPYQAGGRDFNWIKYKKSYHKSALADTIDAVVMGYDVGQGKRAGFGIGDFLIGVYDSKSEVYLTIAKIGTGLTDDEWQKMKKLLNDQATSHKPQEYKVNKIMNVDVWCKPKIVVEIQADEITKSPMHTAELALRFPRLISWREKKPEDATTLGELQDMYKKQSSSYNET